MNSPLATSRYPAHPNNYWGVRGYEINKIIIHHMAAVWTAKRCAESFQDPDRGASSNYCIGFDGEIAVSVDESLASGCSNNELADRSGITIETANSEIGGEWRVSDKALASLVSLCADIARRNNLGRLVPGKNLCWHQMYAATACPGPYLLSKMDYIADAANKINTPADGSKGQIAGVNINRESNMLVIYTGKESTGTNPYGYEVATDKNGIALASPLYGVGNMKIPRGGRVYSGHGEAGKWLSDNIKEGSLVWTEASRVNVAYGRLFRTVDGKNAPRQTNHLCVYDRGDNAPTNKWGYEVSVMVGTATINPVYGVGGMKIPSGGYVLSGHGKAGKWISENIRKGTEVEFDGAKVSIKVK